MMNQETGPPAISSPMGWSKWQWIPQYKSFGRHRVLDKSGGFEYDYARNIEQYNDTVPYSMPDASCTESTGTTAVEGLDNSTYSNGIERPFSCSVVDCVAGVKNWNTQAKLDSHNRNWHGPWHCEYSDCSRGVPNGFPSNSELIGHEATVHGSTTPFSSLPSPEPVLARPMTGPSNIAYPRIRPREKSLDRDSSPVFKEYRSKDFQFGRIFKILWSEPPGAPPGAIGGTSGSSVSMDSSTRQQSYTKVRRFLIIAPKHGHSLCIPILTYGGQGALKHGARPEDHAVIYSSKAPRYHPGEKALITKSAIKCVMNSSHNKLDPSSRLNYAKLYTVETNVKVMFIGKVAEDFEQRVVIDFNRTNPPLSDRPLVIAKENSIEPSTTNLQEHGYLGSPTSQPTFEPSADVPEAQSYPY